MNEEDNDDDSLSSSGGGEWESVLDANRTQRIATPAVVAVAAAPTATSSSSSSTIANENEALTFTIPMGGGRKRGKSGTKKKAPAKPRRFRKVTKEMQDQVNELHKVSLLCLFGHMRCCCTISKDETLAGVIYSMFAGAIDDDDDNDDDDVATRAQRIVSLFRAHFDLSKINMSSSSSSSSSNRNSINLEAFFSLYDSIMHEVSRRAFSSQTSATVAFCSLLRLFFPSNDVRLVFLSKFVVSIEHPLKRLERLQRAKEKEDKLTSKRKAVVSKKTNVKKKKGDDLESKKKKKMLVEKKKKRKRKKKGDDDNDDDNDDDDDDDGDDDDDDDGYEEDEIQIQSKYFSPPSSQSTSTTTTTKTTTTRTELAPPPTTTTLCPHLFCEIFSPTEKRYISIDILNGSIDNRSFVTSNDAAYVFAVEFDGSIVDVSLRYAFDWVDLSSFRFVINSDEDAWFTETLQMLKSDASSAAVANRRQLEEQELRTIESTIPMPTTIGAFKNHPCYCLERHLPVHATIYPKVSIAKFKNEEVYSRRSVANLHTEDKWLQQARTPRAGEVPVKRVKARVNPSVAGKLQQQQREAANLEDRTVGLYGRWQTEAYRPPLLDASGRVPSNRFGNIYIYRPSMCPPLCTHVNLPYIASVARRLKINYVNANVGWEVKGGRSFPKLEGIVVKSVDVPRLTAAHGVYYEKRLRDDARRLRTRVHNRFLKLCRLLLRQRKVDRTYKLLINNK